MVCIKIKAILILLIISILIAIAVTSFTQGKAEEQITELIFVEEPSYNLKNKIEKNDMVIGWNYEIFVKIKNVGSKRSEPIIVNLTDDEGFVLKHEKIFEPYETKTVVFNWSTLTKKDHNLHISFYPADLDTQWNNLNSDKTQLILKMLEEGDISGTSTPGYEMLTLIAGIVVTIIILKKYRK